MSPEVRLAFYSSSDLGISLNFRNKSISFKWIMEDWSKIKVNILYQWTKQSQYK